MAIIDNPLMNGLTHAYDIDKYFLEKKFTGWYAPSMFGTSYGRMGYKIEVEAYEYKNGVNTKNHDSYNIDGSNYYSTKKMFWKYWNQDHQKETLVIGKFMSSWGL